MSFSQISSSTLTVISSVIGKGFSAISLTDFTTSALTTIASGSTLEIAGTFFLADSDITPNSSSWSAISTTTSAWLALTPSGTSGSQIISAAWTSTEPVWSTSKQAYYASAASLSRVVALVQKAGTSTCGYKSLIPIIQGVPIKIRIPIGSWDMDATTQVYSVYYGSLDKSKIANVSVEIANDNSPAGWESFNNWTTSEVIGNDGAVPQKGINWGAGQYRFTLARNPSGRFDSTYYNDSTINRGYVTFDYYI